MLKGDSKEDSLDCKRHPGKTTEFTCLECGQQFCRDCVMDTGVSHHCPDCHQEYVQRFATKLREPQERAREEARKRAELKRKKKEAKELKKEEKEAKKLKKPAASRMKERKEKKADLDIAEAPPPPPEEVSGEQEAFWADVVEPKRRAKKSRRRMPPEPLRIEGLPPAPGKADKPTAPPDMSLDESADAVPRLVPDSKKRKLMSPEERKKAVMVSEGFPERQPGEAVVKEPRRAAKHAARIVRRKRRREIPVAMQMPDEYDGEISENPSYLKAVLWSLLVGAVGAGAYAGIAWWRHREFGIFGWVIGVGVGLAIVLGSGRHFSWRLGLIAAAISMFFISVGRILVYMLDIWFPDILKLPVGTMDNLNHAIKQFWRQLPTSWLIFLFVTGLVAFLISFRPWPLKLQVSEGSSSKKVTPRA